MRTGFWAAAFVAAVASPGSVLHAQQFEFTGEVGFETRLFPQAPRYPGQQGARFSPSVRFEPEFMYEWGDGAWRFTTFGFLRLDAHDGRRTHVDLRELGLLYLGDRVTAFAGLGKVFWGVTEVNHLVDVINQTDAVEDIDSEDKLGQPMVNFTLEGGWGSLDLFYLPRFRERTFPGGDARLRGPAPISTDATFESNAGAWHQDFALRWSRPFGAFDVGTSFFRGTSREPRFRPSTDAQGAPFLRPHYDVIDQFGLDVQWTGNATLLKFEAITRGGYGDRFVAATGGIEYTLYQILSGSGDLGLLAEFMLDGRDVDAPPTVFDNDVFVGFRWALNDVHDTSILGGPVIDYDTGEMLALIEAERRIGDDWRFELEARLFANTARDGTTSGLRRDGFFALRLSRYF
jgi:hypothetical protein